MKYFGIIAGFTLVSSMIFCQEAIDHNFTIVNDTNKPIEIFICRINKAAPLKNIKDVIKNIFITDKVQQVRNYLSSTMRQQVKQDLKKYLGEDVNTLFHKIWFSVYASGAMLFISINHMSTIAPNNSCPVHVLFDNTRLNFISSGCDIDAVIIKINNNLYTIDGRDLLVTDSLFASSLLS